MERPLQAFISHQTEHDGEFAHRLARDLERLDVRVWIAPESINPGESWAAAIQRGLEESTHMLVVCTPAGMNSPWVDMETNSAIALERRGRLTVIPLDVRACRVPLFLQTYQMISFRRGYQTGLEGLTSRLALLGEGKPKVPEEAVTTVGSLDWRRLHHDEATIVDLRGFPDLKISLFNRALTGRFELARKFDPLAIRTDFTRLEAGGLDVQLSTVYAPERGLLEECQDFWMLRYLMPVTYRRTFGRPYVDVTMDMLDAVEREVESANQAAGRGPLAQLVHSVEELDALLALDGDRPIALIHSVAGAHSLDGQLDNLERLFDRGVACLSLVQFFENECAPPCFQWTQLMQQLGCFTAYRDVSLPLKSLGEQLVEKMMALGMLVDVSYCTPPARWRIYKIVGDRMPLLATHAGAYELDPQLHNLKDWEIRRIADSGGVIGLPVARSLDSTVRTINHFFDVGGSDHIGLGSDFNGFSDPADDLCDASQLPRLTIRLVAEGYPQDTIIKFLGGNALRVLREGWGKRE